MICKHSLKTIKKSNLIFAKNNVRQADSLIDSKNNIRLLDRIGKKYISF